MSVVVCCGLLLAALPLSVGGGAESVPPASPSLDAAPDPVPAGFFTENAGQLDNREVRYYAASGFIQVGFEESAVLIKVVERSPAPDGVTSLDRTRARPFPTEPESSRELLVRLDFEGANRVVPQGRNPVPHPTNFFLGSDPSRWRTGVRSYTEVAYANLYDGIDLVYRIGGGGLKYDFLVRPGADPARIRMAYEGIDSLDVGPGALVLRTVAGDVRDDGLVATAGGVPVDCAFARAGLRAAGFACAGWDRAQTLVIDPIVWATFLGGNFYDSASDLVLDASGNPVVVGFTQSATFPTTPGAYDRTRNGSGDTFVAKLSADGSSLLWSTYLGGGDSDNGVALVLDASGNPIVVGLTSSADFPATPGAYDTKLNGTEDAFAAKLSADGSSLLWATFLGGSANDEAYAVALDVLGNPVLAGMTESSNFPATPGAYDVTHNGPGFEDAFAAKLSADGSSLLWATFLGGNNREVARGLALDASGDAVVAGPTVSPDFPVTPGAYDVTYAGSSFYEVYVAKLSADGSSLVWATFLGGSADDEAFAVALDASGDPVVVGLTESSDFPVTPGAYDVTYASPSYYEAFVAKLSAGGSSLLWATFLGGTHNDAATATAINAQGNPVVGGYTMSSDFPTTPNAFDTVNTAGVDAFVVELSGDGSHAYLSSYLGGEDGDEVLWAVAIDASGNATVAGYTVSPDFPATPGAYDVTYNSIAADAFVAKLWLVNAPGVKITSPSGGETWTQGTLHAVGWTVSDVEDPPSALLVWINYTSGAGSGTVCGPVAGDVGSCGWTLPMIAATDVTVTGVVIDTDGLKGYGESGPFTIRAPPGIPPVLTITSPSGGEAWIQGSLHVVDWTAVDDRDPPSALHVWINYTSGVGSGTICGPIAGNVGSCDWTLPSITATDIFVNGTVVDTGGLKGYDDSGPLTVQAPPPPPPVPPDFLREYWWVIAVLMIAVAVALILLVAVLKRRRSKEEEAPPPEQRSPPPSA